MPRARRAASPARPRAVRPPDGSNDRWRSKAAPSVLRSTVGPAILLLVCPCAVNAFALAVKELDASLVALAAEARRDGFGLLRRMFPAPTVPAVAFLAGLLALQLALLLAVPGARFDGPRAPSGHVPRYTDNGFRAFGCTLCVLGACVAYGLLPPTLIFDELLPIMTTLNGGALLLSLALYAKGRSYPSTADCGSSGALVMDLYWGLELYPRVCGVDMKQLFIARYGIVLWCLFALSFAARSAAVAGTALPPTDQLVSASLMAVYIAKFFWWERWYMHAADIQVDRLGFMMCWGPICFMPLVHTLQNLHLAEHAGLGLSRSAAAAYLIIGNAMTYINYEADTQRHRVRASDGKCTVWGKPATFIRATYTTADGKTHKALLSTCGYQGLARHFHYAPDIVNLFLYCSPAGFGALLPHLYFIYLTVLLLDRTWRIDARCAAKYGAQWERYVALVPHRLLPGVF